MNPRGGADHVESGTPWKGYFQPQSKSILHRQSRVQQPSRAQVADLRHQTEPESLTNRSLEGVRRDGFATGPVPSNYAHGARACAERGASRWLPNKMAMAQAAYFVAQQIYARWVLFGIVLCGALVANLAHAIVLRKLGRPFGYALASFLLIAANLAIFFVWTFPTNQATNNWTVVPKNWNALRIRCNIRTLPMRS